MSLNRKKNKPDFINVYERILTDLAHTLKSALPSLTLILISLLIAQAAVTKDKFILLPVLAIIGGSAGIFLLRNRQIFYWIIVISSPMNDHLAIPLGGANLRPYNLLGMLGVAWFLLALMRDEEKDMMKRLKFYWIPLSILALFAVSKVLTVYSMNNLPPGMTKIFSFKFVIFAIFLYVTLAVTLGFIKNLDQALVTMKYWIHLSNGIILLAFIQILLSNVAPSTFHYVHHRDVIAIGRPYSCFREPDVLASFVGSTFMTCLCLLTMKRTLLPRLYLTATLAAHAFFLLILMVRAAWLAAGAACFLFFIALLRMGYFKHIKLYINIAALTGLLGVTSLFALAPKTATKFFGRFTSIVNTKSESSASYRTMELNHQKSHVTQHDSITGYALGHGDFSWSYYAPIICGNDYDQDAAKNAKNGQVLIHSGFYMMVTIAHDNGFLGLTIFLLFLLYLFINYWKTTNDLKDNDHKLLVHASFISIVEMLFCFQITYDPITPFLYVMMGLHLAICYHLRKVEAGEQETNYELKY